MLLFFSSVSKAEKWVITTLEWPPFTCSRCPENGAAAKALRELLKTQGVQVEFRFSSWTQAVKDGAAASKVGYFPAWNEDVKEGFVASDALFQSPIGFIEPRGKPLIWNKLSDLKGKTIGIAQDYGNTAEFNKLVKEGVIKTETVESDDTNIRKVAIGKIDGALLDINNAKYFLAGSLKNLSRDVVINSKVIETKTLHVMFNSHNRDKNAVIQAGLKKVRFQKMIDDYMAKYMAEFDYKPCEFCFSPAYPVLAQDSW